MVCASFIGVWILVAVFVSVGVTGNQDVVDFLMANCGFVYISMWDNFQSYVPY